MLHAAQQADQHNEKAVRSTPEAGPADGSETAAAKQMEIAARSSAVQFGMLDAQITPGSADAMPFAQNWALRQSNTPQTVTTTTSPTPRGKLDAIRFEIMLWLPAGWKTPMTLEVTPSPRQ